MLNFSFFIAASAAIPLKKTPLIQKSNFNSFSTSLHKSLIIFPSNFSCIIFIKKLFKNSSSIEMRNIKASWFYRISFFGLLMTLGTKAVAQSLSDFFNASDLFFQTYVTAGQVDYKAIAEQPESLYPLKELYSEMDLSNQDANTVKAFWINAYNLAVINSIIEHYPLQSPREVAGFFNILKHRIAGREMSLNDLEKKKLLEVDQDARLHFVLICAARSCPPMAAFAYRPEQLEEQLNQRTQIALNDPVFIQVEEEKKRIALSEIFRWYVSDFENAGGIRTFINRFRSESLPASYKFRYYNYDWSLNDQALTNQENIPVRYRATRLLDKRQFELKIFNALYTQREFNGFNQLNSRSTYFSSFIQYLKGTNRSFNYGFDLVLKANRVHDFHHQSPFRVFDFQESSGFQTSIEDSVSDTLRSSDGKPLKTEVATGLAHFGPKIKFTPIKKWTSLSLQQTLYIPIQKKVDGQTISFTQLFYDQPIGSRFQLFAEASLWTPLRPQFRIDAFVKFFFSYFPTRRWTVYAMTTIPYEYGAGTKYFITPNVELELLYTYYAPLERYVGDNRPRTLNFGIRVFR